MPAWWPRFSRVAGPLLGLVLAGIAGFALWRISQTTDWPTVAQAIAARMDARLILGAGLLLVSTACFTSYDWIASRVVGRPLGLWSAAQVALVAQGIALNIGNSFLMGGLVRLRLLVARDWPPLDIAGQTMLCVLAANLGAATLGGWAWLLAGPPAPMFTLLLAVGGVLLAPVLVGSCANPAVRVDPRIPVPPVRTAALLVGLGVVEKIASAGLLALLLPALGTPLPTVLACFLAAVVVGKASQVPGGLGVIEVAFLHLLPVQPTGLLLAETLAALLLWRVGYYLTPALFGAVLYVAVRARPGT